MKTSGTLRRSLYTLAILASSLSLTEAHGSHGDHGSHVDTSGMSWGERHMLEEHHIGNFDPGAFFQLHDIDKSGTLNEEEIIIFYGLGPQNTEVTPEKKQAAAKEVMRLIDHDRDGHITQSEFVDFYRNGGTLPDFGYGPGHHGDDEYEYEIHHFEKYHSDDSPDSELNHPEDIEHFKKHEELERARLAQEHLEKQAILPANIPAKFLKPQENQKQK